MDLRLVDIWAVGRLIKDISKCIPGFPHELLEFANDMQATPMTAAQAFEVLRGFCSGQVQ
jgi:hypothetical protein